ncbi:MAG: YerC/YecD family TrpR-related protein [Woeseiaceae bacterium]
MKPNRQIDSRRQKSNEQALSKAFASLADPRSVQAFLKDICTPAELQALADRWQVALLLREELSYRAIHDQTGVSVTTIGRVARYVSSGAGGYLSALQAIE